MTDVKASIIICTRNRAEHLALTLDSLRGICLPEEWQNKVELLIVDNNSTDNTATLVSQTVLPQIQVRQLLVKESGLSRARNAAVRDAKGEVIVFTDDDVRFPKLWLSAVTEPIRTGKADIVAGGIKLAPHLQWDWMEAYHRGMYASTEGFTVEKPPLAVGGNCAYHRRILEKVPRYDTELGAGTTYTGEDLLFSNQVKEAGFTLRGAVDEDATVEHHYDASRVDAEHMWARARREGRALAYIDYHWHHVDEPRAKRLALKRRLRFAQFRLSDRGKVMPTHRELSVYQDIYYYRHLAELRGTARKYEKHGLVKLDGSRD